MARNIKSDRNDRGQILIPALFILPSLFLVIFLLIETGNLSRAKIRQQFALDAAAAVEMEYYTDTLNRLAYLNGVFPDRIFRDVYGSSFHKYRGSGLYPGAPTKVDEGAETWPIQYSGARTYANDPDFTGDFGILHMHKPGGGAVSISNAEKVAVSYRSIYRALGDVATSTKVLFEHTTMDHSLLRSGLMRNLVGDESTGLSACAVGNDNCGDDAAKSFLPLDIKMHYLQGFKHCPTIISIGGVSYVGELTGAFSFNGRGLWQLATVPSKYTDALERGYVVKHHWQVPKNYFGIDFMEGGDTGIFKKDTGNIDEYEVSTGGIYYDISFPESSTGGPYVRTRVTSSGGHVWPNTTPTYFTKLHP